MSETTITPAVDEALVEVEAVGGRGPVARVLRTVAQIVVGIAGGLPLALAGVDLPASTAAAVAGICGTVAAVVALVMNAADSAFDRG